MYKEQVFHVNHVTEHPGRVTDQVNPDGTHDHIPAEGEIIQQGTPNNAQSRNLMENGIQDAHIGLDLLLLDHYRKVQEYDAHNALMDSEVLGEEHEISLTNNLKFPYNQTVDSPTSVPLTTHRKNLFYTVETSVKKHTGEVGEIRVTDKALNGFKLGYTGSATAATITVRVKGGMT